MRTSPIFPYGTSWERVDTLIRFLCCGYFLTPPSLRATSPIFCDAKHPVRLRDTAGEECEIFQRFCFTGVLSSPILRLLLLSIADEGGEKPMLDSVSVTVGIFRHFH